LIMLWIALTAANGTLIIPLTKSRFRLIVRACGDSVAVGRHYQ
jgi:hypothetical protein